MTARGRNKPVVHLTGGQVRAAEGGPGREYERYHKGAPEPKSGRFRKGIEGLRGWHVLFSRLSYCLFI
jgi:hypothetical protein